MRTHRWISVFTLAAGLALAACDVGGTEQPAGYSAADGGSAVNDTTPHRPGAP